MSNPGASIFATPPPPTLPPETIPTPAEQNQIDLQNTIDKSNAKELFCDSLDPNAPLDLSTECDCYRTSIALIRSELHKWDEYNRKNEAYDTYIDDKEAWDQRKLAKREAYTKERSYAGCGTCGTQPNCNKKSLQGNWENTGSRSGCGFLGLGCKSQCKYSTKGLDSLMATWTVANPSPKEPQNPDLPEDISAVNFQCCVNLIDDVVIEKAAQILQSCSQEINNALPPDERDEAEDYEQGLEDAAINTKLAITNRAKEREKTTNITLIIIISVTIVILIIIVVLLLIYGRKQTPSLKVD